MRTSTLVLLAALSSTAAAEDLHTRAMRLHASAIVVDTHEDVPERLAEKWDDAASDAIEDLIIQAVKREQQSGRRRRPFSSRSGYTPF